MMLQTFIVCHFNFCPVVWHFCTVQDFRKIKKIQYIGRQGMSTTISLLVIIQPWGNRPLMYVQRLRQMMIEVYKVYHNIGSVYMESLFNKADPFYYTRCVKPLEQLSFYIITYRYNFFTSQGTKEWNRLNRVFKKALSVEDFKVTIRTWNGKQYTAVFGIHVFYKCKSSIYVFSWFIPSTHFVHVPPHICCIIICHIVGQ